MAKRRKRDEVITISTIPAFSVAVFSSDYPDELKDILSPYTGLFATLGIVAIVTSGSTRLEAFSDRDLHAMGFKRIHRYAAH